MLNIFKRFKRDEFEEFFKELFVPLKPIEYLSHPADGILRAYLSGRLSNQWRLDDPKILERLMQGKLDDWQRAEVSTHLLTCPPCSRKIATWREAETARVKEVERPRELRRWAYRLGALIVVGVLIFLIWSRPEKPQTVHGQLKSPNCESPKCVGEGGSGS